ncbi:MAG: CoA transferase [Deltaproteobacteria bacterium]|nr:CoA transferase [Deltaproteobacteria bacterium]
MPLRDVTILDLTRQLPGPFCSQILADFGAQVIKIEGPGGDPIRGQGPKLSRESAYFLGVNRNKRSLVLNLKAKGGREVFFRLAQRADIIIEGFRPGVVERLGIGYQDIARVNPRIIYCSLSGYGQDGPYHQRPGHDINYIALGGILGLTGKRGSPPVIPGGQIADLTGGLLAALGLMLGLWARQKTGRGQYIDVAMLDGVISWLPFYLGEYMAEGTIPRRGEMLLNGGYACYNLYETKDGAYMTLGALEPHFWEAFCREIGREDLISDQFAAGKRQKEMIQELQKIFMQRTQQEWIKFWEEKDIPCEPVLSLEEVLSHPQVLSRGMVKEIDHPTEGTIRQLGVPIKLSDTPGDVRTPPPLLGEHTGEILRWLGYSKQEIKRLEEEGVI